MRQIPIHSIESNQIFDQCLFLASGQKLLDAGVPISASLLELMKRENEVDLILASDFREVIAAGVVDTFDRRSLVVGEASREQLVSGAGRTVVSAGQTIEAHHLDALDAAGAAFKLKPSAADGAQRNELIALAEAQLEQFKASEEASIPLRAAANGGPAWLQWKDADEDWPDRAALTRLRHEEVEVLRRAYAQLEAGIVVSIDSFTQVVDRLMERLPRHPQRFTQLALLVPQREDYLPDHAYAVAVLSMASAARMGWPREHVHHVGLAGLLFDLGMLLIEQRIRVGASQLSEMDRARVQRHTEFSFAMLHPIGGVPGFVKLVALQHHERENGTGYPYRRRLEEIADHARVIAAADTFAAMIEPRHHRRPLLPYKAMEQTIRSASARSLWAPACKALLQSVGLFPVGSYVKLSNGESACVVAANPDAVDRPLVQPVSPTGVLHEQVIDLSALDRDALSVVRAVEPPAGASAAA